MDLVVLITCSLMKYTYLVSENPIKIIITSFSNGKINLNVPIPVITLTITQEREFNQAPAFG